jgi:hypothetical protein
MSWWHTRRRFWRSNQPTGELLVPASSVARAQVDAAWDAAQSPRPTHPPFTTMFTCPAARRPRESPCSQAVGPAGVRVCAHLTAWAGLLAARRMVWHARAAFARWDRRPLPCCCRRSSVRVWTSSTPPSPCPLCHPCVAPPAAARPYAGDAWAAFHSPCRPVCPARSGRTGEGGTGFVPGRLHQVESTLECFEQQPVHCQLGCGEMYCSVECCTAAHDRGHRLLCVGPLTSTAHPLYRFKKAALASSGQEEFLLAAQARALALAHDPWSPPQGTQGTTRMSSSGVSLLAGRPLQQAGSASVWQGSSQVVAG